MLKLRSWFNPQFLHHRIGLGGAALGILLVLWAVFFAPTVASLDCTRQSNYYSVCTLQTNSLVGIPLQRRTLDPLKGAQLFPNVPMRGWTNRVMFYLSEGVEIPFSPFSVSAQTARQATDQINAFLGNPEIPTFRYGLLVPPAILGTVLAGAIALVGMGFLLLRIR